MIPEEHRGVANHPWALLLWLLLIGGGAACMGVFLYAAWTYHGYGDARVVLQPAAAGGWRQQTFRVIGTGEYSLSLEAVNHTPPFGAPFRGAIELQVLDPDRRQRDQRNLGPGIPELIRPENRSSVHAGTLSLASTQWWKPWVLQARVQTPDPAFAGVHLAARIDRVHPDFGLGGVVLFFMIVPAAILWMVSVFPALHLRSEAGAGWPLGVTFFLIAANLVGMLAAAL